MVKKILFISLALFGLLFSSMAEECLADAATQFKQAETYKKNKQYDQAEQIYQQILINFPDSNDALEAQKQLTCLYIVTDSQQQADAAFTELTASFAGHKEIAEAIWRVGRAYMKAKKFNKAEEAHQYNVGHFPADVYAMWSQVDIVKFYIGDGNDAAAAAAVDRLLSVFASQPTLPKEIHQLSNKYSKTRRGEKAMELRKYNVARFPKDKYAMLSQVEIVGSYIRDPNAEEAVVDAEVDKLLSVFASQPTLPMEIHQLSNKYSKARRREKAMELRKYNIARFPKNKFAMRSQVEIVGSYIRDPNAEEAVVDAAVNKLLGAFASQPTLPKEIRKIANRYNKAGKFEKGMELHKYNVARFPKDRYAMWSQMDIIYSYIDPNDGDDAAADAAVDKLLTVFADQPTLPRKVHFIANRYRKIGKYERAIQFYQLAVEMWPEGKIAITPRVGIGQVHIALGDDEAVWAIIDGLIADFNDHPALPGALFSLGEKYYNRAFHRENEGLDTEAKDNFKKAIAVWERIITQLQPNAVYPAQAYYFSAVCYSRLRQHTKAIEHYQNVVDNWPDCENASRAQFMVARIYEHLKRTGALPESEAVAMIKAAYERILQEYPDSRAANPARRRLNYYQQLKQGERK